jgi:putative Ca2+/H+ antiporter (TMEM165/GDT1 family)
MESMVCDWANLVSMHLHCTWPVLVAGEYIDDGLPAGAVAVHGDLVFIQLAIVQGNNIES